MKNNTELLDKIKNAIAPEYQLLGVSSLIEKNIDSKGNDFVMNVEIRSRKGLDVLICRFDTNKDLFPYFQNKAGYKKNCDYIVFAENAVNLYVFLVELKKTTASPKAQLNISKSFAEFLISRIEAVSGAAGKEIVYRMIGIKEKARFCKSTTKGFVDEYTFDDDGYLLLPRKDYMDLDKLINN